MHAFHLSLPRPTGNYAIENNADPQITCTIFENEEGTTVFLEMPNWSNGWLWTQALAMQAWLRWERDERRLNIWNPSDVERFRIFRVRPGVPKGEIPLWKEPFTWYRAVTREQTLVQRILPVAGACTYKEKAPVELGVVLAEVGSGAQLKHFRIDGHLRP